ncbi:D-alanine--D-alanine ligase [bacterium]|nr:D-alanine--D-alanine ligase [bacterium]
MTKKKIAVIFGGRSPEHTISITSAMGILQNIDRSEYEVVPVRISMEGEWNYLPDLELPESLEDLKNPGFPAFLGDPSTAGLIVMENDKFRTLKLDAVFPVLHGPFGEDGTIQGQIHMAGLPCVGAGIAASALGMDKVLMKEIFLQDELPAVDFIWFLRSAWREKQKEITQAVEKEIGFPCFVKPANAGSSVGITKVKDVSSLVPAVDEAAQYDRKILIEKGINGREFECGILGNDKPEASVVGEIIPANEFYDYDAKYEDKGSKTEAPADIPHEISERVRNLAKKAFTAIDCSGMARVDFLYDTEKNEIYLNEINTIPGFTPISMYPVLWDKSGVTYSELITRLIELAFERFDDLSQSNIVMKI